LKDAESATRLLIRRVESCLRGQRHVAHRLHKTIDSVLKLWQDDGNLSQATVLLRKMQELHESNLLPQGPDKRSFYPLLKLWRKSKVPHRDKEDHIEYLESKIKELYNDD